MLNEIDLVECNWHNSYKNHSDDDVVSINNKKQ